jgi:hypothetical protein
MLEILFLMWFVRKLAALAKDKGRSGSWGGLGALFWIGGEVMGMIGGQIAGAGAGAYLIALLCAGAGAGAAYAIVSSLGSVASGYEMGGDKVNPHYDPSNPYSPPRGGEAPPGG